MKVPFKIMDFPILDRVVRGHKTTTNMQDIIILVRILVGAVFISEGIQKFLFPDSLGVGRFIKIGIPAPELTAPFVGTVEIVCGAMILLGLFTSLAAIPLIISMSVAVWTTKIPLLLESGFWKMAHEARTDWAMIFGLIFLLFSGGGRWSLDELRMTSGIKIQYQQF
jgi:putative oxidoreductase